MRNIVVLAAMSLLMADAAFGQDTVATPDLIEGTWQTPLLSEVTIVPCAVGFCGVLSRIVVPSEGLTAEEYAAAQAMTVESFTDLRNPDPALRGRPMLGLQILTLQPGGKPNIYDGTIYNPEDGNTYTGYVEMLSAEMLRLNGCVLYNVVCQGQDWVRVVPEPKAEVIPSP